jgi:hypothetical protein
MVDARLGVVVLACLVAVLNGFRQAHDPAFWGAAPPQPQPGVGRKPAPRDARLDAHFAQCAPCTALSRAAAPVFAARSRPSAARVH